MKRLEGKSQPSARLFQYSLSRNQERQAVALGESSSRTDLTAKSPKPKNTTRNGLKSWMSKTSNLPKSDFLQSGQAEALLLCCSQDIDNG